MSEKFSLKWNDFLTNASKSFGLFRNEDYLHDVTLVSNDQHQVTAHKLVLSASSDYFKNIFKNNKHSNPLLCFDGISSLDLNNILDYIYNGEVQICQEDLDRFLTVAERLKIEGLIGGQNKEVKEEEKEIADFSPFAEIETWKPVKTKIRQTTIATDTTSIQLNNQIDTSDLVELDQKLSEYMEQIYSETNNLLYSCKICNKQLKNKKDMKFHVESHMEGLSFPCHTCGKEFRSRNSIKMHNSRFHKLKNDTF